MWYSCWPALKLYLWRMRQDLFNGESSTLELCPLLVCQCLILLLPGIFAKPLFIQVFRGCGLLINNEGSFFKVLRGNSFVTADTMSHIFKGASTQPLFVYAQIHAYICICKWSHLHILCMCKWHLHSSELFVWAKLPRHKWWSYFEYGPMWI